VSQDLVPVVNVDCAANTRATTIAATTDKRAGKAAITTAATDTLAEDTACIQAKGFDQAPVLNQYVAAVTASRSIAATAVEKCTGAATGAATTANTLAEDCV
jgi:hypothetical protein